MDAVFLKILNMSLAASWLILAVIVLRLIFKKVPKNYVLGLWLVVALRLVCPFTLESDFSLVPSAATVPQEVIDDNSFAVPDGPAAIGAPINENIAPPFPGDEAAPLDAANSLMVILGMVWLAGAAAMLAYALISYGRIKNKVSEGVELKDNIWLCDSADTPFILGFIRPRIFLPSAMEEGHRDYVIAHENAHLKRRDHWWKPLGFALLAVYWFNPLCWLAYWLFCRDIEMACDETVIKDWDAPDKKAYSEALLSCSVPPSMIAACPLAFGEVGVKQRIKNVLNYREPSFWFYIVATMVCSGVMYSFLTAPKSDDVVPVDAAPPADVSSVGVTAEDETDPAQAIARLQGLGIMEGYPDGTFGEDNTLTRAEISKIAILAADFKGTALNEQGALAVFTDVEPDYWAHGWITAAARKGFIKGDGEGQFRPDDTLTQAEALTVLLRVLGYDDELPGAWPANYVAKAAMLGVLDNVIFLADPPITREEVAVITAAILEQSRVEYDAANNIFEEIVEP